MPKQPSGELREQAGLFLTQFGSMTPRIDLQELEADRALNDVLYDNFISTVLQKGDNLACSLPENSAMRGFVNALISYLDKRKKEPPALSSKLQEKIGFINECFDFISQNNMEALKQHLAKPNIKEFKGMGTHTFYDLLSQHRALLFGKEEAHVNKKCLVM